MGGQEDNSLEEAPPEPETPGEDKRERERGRTEKKEK
jgi:hypothetical protein